MQHLVLSRHPEPPPTLDLNKATSSDTTFPCNEWSINAPSGLDVPAPWDLGFGSPYDTQQAAELFALLEGINTSTHNDLLSASWLAHSSPTFIEVKGHSARIQLLAQQEFSADMVDIFIRRFRQLDAKYYTSLPQRRWRHFVESTYMAISAAGWLDRSKLHVRDQFCGPHFSYYVPLCKLLFFPLLVHERWVGFATLGTCTTMR
ncbi:hypothetical protein BS78_02G381600 [Paspalum vaginatum]|nr:hypothetical protein BS78_02G381600 [Paspalum vaginatum]